MMTPADRTHVRRMSLCSRRGLLSRVTQRPSSYPLARKGDFVSLPDTDARQTEYSTYAPAGERCRRCRKPFKSLETCRRVANERQSGTASADRYEHVRVLEVSAPAKRLSARVSALPEPELVSLPMSP
ncbi:gp25.2 [Streptomyces phage phiBT1]|uniref:Gp25.2 n=1 Tax=Lomovskayavirus BT1 TaxID=225588 RepID=Q858X5_9CAUD|nr:gp25.2 [Streptomyces phage phiBT1]CAD80150.1 gp25.2 [Lomovskayavirus BT1]